MTIGFHIIDALRNYRTRVSFIGELLIRPQFQSAEKITLTVADTAVNIVKPRAGEQIIVTGILVNTNRAVGVNGAAIEIYEASSESSTVVDKSIFSFDLVKNQNVGGTGLLIKTTEGVFINAKADDVQVNITFICYFFSSRPKRLDNT